MFKTDILKLKLSDKYGMAAVKLFRCATATHEKLKTVLVKYGRKSLTYNESIQITPHCFLHTFYCDSLSRQ